MREQPKIAVESLRACLQNSYGLSPVTIEFLPIGLDYQAGVYRVLSEQGTFYFLKVTSRPLYEPSFLIPRYLRDQGISSVVAPLPTMHNTLWASVEKWTIIVYPFLHGDASWLGMTDKQWEEVGAIFGQIHSVALPTYGFRSLRKETFDSSEYAQWVQNFEATHLEVREVESTSKRTLRALWMAHQPTIHIVLTSLEKLSMELQTRKLPYVICHADLHPANLLRDPSGRVFVIDWDEVMLAPKERDLLFIKESSNDNPSLPGAPTFFQGYGQTEIDWTVLTYFRYERVIQDLIACAQEVFSRDDLGEGTKTDSVQLFRSILSEGGEIDIATQASTHLPSNLAIPTRMVGGIGKELAKREEG